MSRASVQLKKYAILFHRWLGVIFCLLFAAWFVSGIAMMYWDYPGVGPGERLARAQALDASKIRVSPDQAYRTLENSEPPDDAHLAMLDSRPVYRFRAGRGQYIVYADDGKPLEDVTREMALRAASSWTGLAATAARFEGVHEDIDQWTLSEGLHNLMPLYKFSWPNREEVYVSEVTGEVVQDTTPGSRLGAYFGAIPHWLYFVPLRRDGELWTNTIIWASGIGTGVSLLGLVVGLVMYSPSKRYRFPQGPSSVPYVGQKRWHTILGLTFGLVTCTWVFSGLLSMEPFDWQTRGGAVRLAGALRGGKVDLAAFAAKPPQNVLTQLAAEHRPGDDSAAGGQAANPGAKDLELRMFAGEPVYVATTGLAKSLIIPVHGSGRDSARDSLPGSPAPGFDRVRILDLVANASRPLQLAEVRLVTEYEAYYLDRHHERPLPVIFVRLNDADSSMYYIDPRTARVVASYSTGSRWSRWLYHGFHSIDLPWLYRYRPAWDITVLALMLGGVSLSVTSIVIGWRRLRRKLSAWRILRTRHEDQPVRP